MNALGLIELLKETKRLELDLAIHKQYRDIASDAEREINEYLINQAEKKLRELSMIAVYQR